MRRRDFIKVICVSATAWPLTARAQQADRVRLIGVLMAHYLSAFRQEIAERGWAEGRNVKIDAPVGSTRRPRNTRTICEGTASAET
jgi:hypothetical protein